MKLLNIVTLASIAFFCSASAIFIPIVSSVFLFFLIDPIVDWAENKKVNRGLASSGAVLISIALILIILLSGCFAASQIANEVPKYSNRFRTVALSFQKYADRWEEKTHHILSAPKTEPVQKVEVVTPMSKWTDLLISGLNSIFAKITTLSVIPILTFLLLLEKQNLKNRFSIAFPKCSKAGKVTLEIKRMTRGFFVGNLFISLLSGVFFFVIFLSLGLENKVLLAFIAGFLTVIPIIGVFACIVFPMGQAMLQFNSLGPMIVIGVAGIIIHFVVANIILPKVIGSKINVNPIAATLGILFWGWTWGGFGIIIAIPMTALIRILMESFESTRSFAFLLGEEGVESKQHYDLPEKQPGLGVPAR